MPLKRKPLGLVIFLLGGASACGGSPLAVSGDATDSGVHVAALVGSVDLTQAPASLEMACNRDVGGLAFKMPCEVGQNIETQNGRLGFNEIECHMTTSGQPMVWSFLLRFDQILSRPDQPVMFPNGGHLSNETPDYLSGPTGVKATDIGGEAFSISGSTGTISFSRIDSPGRAFSGHLKGTFAWTGTTGSTMSCDVDGPFWGSPGGFL